MTRIGYLLAAAALAVLSTVVRPQGPSEDAGFLTALGRSMGGLRVIAVDAIFLRAEALREAGRVEEVVPLYRTVLELDPDNVAALDFLAALYAYDLLSLAPDDDARLAWWEEARRLVLDGLARHPDDPALRMRQADLLLEVGPRYPGLDARLQQRFGDTRRQGLELLLGIARDTPNLGRRGRMHLLLLAQGIPVAAAARLPGGPEAVDPVLALGDELLRIRGPDLAQMRLLQMDLMPGAPEEGVPLDVLLPRGLAVVRAVQQALAEGRTADAARETAAYAEAGGVQALVDLLEGVIRSAGGG